MRLPSYSAESREFPLGARAPLVAPNPGMKSPPRPGTEGSPEMSGAGNFGDVVAAIVHDAADA